MKKSVKYYKRGITITSKNLIKWEEKLGSVQERDKIFSKCTSALYSEKLVRKENDIIKILE